MLEGIVCYERRTECVSMSGNHNIKHSRAPTLALGMETNPRMRLGRRVIPGVN
jgi:hypothetical protein